MKSLTTKFLALAAASVLLFSACGKYEEGPSFSLRSKEARLVNTWKIVKYLENGTDKTADLSGSDFSITMQKGGSGKSDVTVLGVIVSDDFTWKFSDDKEQLLITDDGDTDTASILMLKEKELWLKFVSGSNTDEFHYEPK